MANAITQPDTLNGSQVAIVAAEIIEDGQAVGLLVKEIDGTVSAIRISVEQLAD